MFKKKKRTDNEDDLLDGGDPFASFFGSSSFNDIFKQMEQMSREMARQMESNMSRMNDPEYAKKMGGKPMVYGFSMNIGPDGKVRFEDFGNVESGKKAIKVKEEREPLVDVMNKEEVITILAELPGVNKDEIKVKVGDSHDKLEVSVPGKFYKCIDLPEKVKPKLGHAHYNNGVLEIDLFKQTASKPGEGQIKVE